MRLLQLPEILEKKNIKSKNPGCQRFLEKKISSKKPGCSGCQSFGVQRKEGWQLNSFSQPSRFFEFLLKALKNFNIIRIFDIDKFRWFAFFSSTILEEKFPFFYSAIYDFFRGVIRIPLFRIRFFRNHFVPIRYNYTPFYLPTYQTTYLPTYRPT